MRLQIINAHRVFVHAEPNVGVVLWLQQFWAMFVKRFYNSLRFYGALVSQFFFPIMFVIFGLAVAVTVPSNQNDDPPRKLLINNSGLDPENLILFYAQFEGGATLNLSVSQSAQLCMPRSERLTAVPRLEYPERSAVPMFELSRKRCLWCVMMKRKPHCSIFRMLSHDAIVLFLEC